MSLPIEFFSQAHLKLVGANHHFRQLQAVWDAFVDTDFCELAVEDQPDGTGQIIAIKSITPIPPALPLLIGDTIHNMKSALDYTISELLGWKDTRLTFPMGETREELEASFRTDGLPGCPTCGRGGKGKGRNARIEEVLPGFGELILDEIKPYKASGGFLWPLNKLDVRDKHRLLVPVIVPQTITGINAVDKNNNGVVNGTVTIVGHYGVPFGLGDGVKIESYGKPTAEILFNEIGIIENQCVFPTLLNMLHATAETITRIGEFASDTGWNPASRT